MKPTTLPMVVGTGSFRFTPTISSISPIQILADKRFYALLQTYQRCYNICTGKQLFHVLLDNLCAGKQLFHVLLDNLCTGKQLFDKCPFVCHLWTKMIIPKMEITRESKNGIPPKNPKMEQVGAYNARETPDPNTKTP
jgi:hypothetical protein